MRARIVKIGNSQGIRIPKALLEHTGIVDDVELELRNGEIVIRPVSRPREGWEVAFKEMAESGEDVLLDNMDAMSHSWDEEEWKW